MNQSNCKYFCLLKGNWQERFFELIEMFQVSLHKKFAIGVPENLTNQYNRIIVYGISTPDEQCFSQNIPLTDEEIFNSYYKNKPCRSNHDCNSTMQFENSSANFFENHWSNN